nr:hypothetical protein [uncultured Sphingobacterium sp.]
MLNLYMVPVGKTVSMIGDLVAEYIFHTVGSRSFKRPRPLPHRRESGTGGGLAVSGSQ